MKLIPLSGKRGAGKCAMVDDGDLEIVNQFKWYLDCQGYAARSIYIKGNKIRQTMHRFIMNAKPGEEVDHRDNNRLNYTRNNLRLCSGPQNMRNRKAYNNNKSGYKGVYKPHNGNKFVARIGYNGTKIYLGRFITAYEGSLAYRAAAKKYHGEFAKW